MSRDVRETLDEAIDRLANTLTAVPADPSFSRRLRARMDSSSQTMSIRFAASAVVGALVAAVAIVVFMRDQRVVDRGVVATTGPENPQAVSGVGERRGRAESGTVVPPPSATTASATPGSAELEPAVSIAALPAPEVLGVDDLMLEPLTIGPVELDVLVIANLEVREITGSDDPKE